MKIELKHVHRYRDRHGKERIYVRVPGRKAVAIHEKPGTEAFLAAYRAAVAKTDIVITTGAPGSFAWLIQRYYGSAECLTSGGSATRHHPIADPAISAATAIRKIGFVPKSTAM